MAAQREVARLSTSKLNRRGERTLPCATPESTHGWEAESPRRTWDRVPQRKLARRCQRRPEMPTSWRRTNVASTQQESKAFLMSMKTTKSVDLIPETQGVHKAANECVCAPTETTLRHIQLW